MASKPTILLVPGAWHLPDCYDTVTEQLKTAGYPCVYAPLPSVGGPEPLKNFDPDVEAIRSKLVPLVESGADVVVVAHSYGSMPLNEAVSGLAKKDRAAAGKPGGVVHYVFCAAFVTPVGVSLMDSLQGKDLPWFIVSDDKTIVDPDGPQDIFYGDLDGTTSAHWISKLRPFSYQVFMSKTTYAACAHVPSTYIYCTEDKAIPLPVQQMMVQGAEASGAKFQTVTIQGSSHSPMISRPGEVVAAIKSAADSSA